ncbi:MAG: radical SAM protein [Candidatus Omnitrophica bacterium]|nr:radical SAM protein [Candidatus Omnitrophota bacterium]
MTAPKFKHIYGPVHSWRMGMSLGIDPLSTKNKACNFNCSYCQLGVTSQFSWERRVFVPTGWVVEEVKSLPADCRIDYLTFSGSGEPTLASNLGEMMLALRDVRPEKIAVITNSTTITRRDVQADLKLADLVLFKIDAADQATFERLNHPFPRLQIADIIKGIKDFRKTFKGKLALQIMFTAENQAQVPLIAQVAKDIAPDEVQLNTPLRPSPVKPLSEAEMAVLKTHFAGLKVLSVYEEEKKPYVPFDDAATEERHGRFKGDKGQL